MLSLILKQKLVILDVWKRSKSIYGVSIDSKYNLYHLIAKYLKKKNIKKNYKFALPFLDFRGFSSYVRDNGDDDDTCDHGYNGYDKSQ